MQIHSIKSTIPIKQTRAVFRQNLANSPMLKTQNTTEKKKDNNWLKWALGLSLVAIIAGICIYNKKRPKLLPEAPKPLKKTAPPKEMPKIVTEKNGNPVQIIGVSEAEAMKLRDEYFELKQWCDTNIDWQTFTPGEGNHKVFLEKFRPLEKKLQEHNISIIRKKEFSSNPLEQVKEKHEYIHYEVLPNADFNEASFFDALEMFEKYGKREEFQRTGVSTLAELESSLPKKPTEASVTKLIKLYGKHVDDFVYPDERDGAPNCITYEQNFLKAARKATTVEQARLVLENVRRMFWSDSNIDDVADAWMVKDGAPLKGNEEVKKILDKMFECAAKNREPFMHDYWLQKKVEMWNRSPRRYKN